MRNLFGYQERFPGPKEQPTLASENLCWVLFFTTIRTVNDLVIAVFFS